MACRKAATVLEAFSESDSLHPIISCVKASVSRCRYATPSSVSTYVIIGHPQPVHAPWTEALDQVRVLTPRVVGACRMTPAAGLEHQPALVHESVESVAATQPSAIDALQDEEQLVGAYAGSLAAELADRPDYLRLGKLTGRALLARHRIITLACLAKQSAQAPDGSSGMPGPKVVYCLAPAFFSKSMPYFSLLIFIISLRASLRNSE